MRNKGKKEVKHQYVFKIQNSFQIKKHDFYLSQISSTKKKLRRSKVGKTNNFKKKQSKPSYIYPQFCKIKHPRKKIKKKKKPFTSLRSSMLKDLENPRKKRVQKQTV